MPERAKRIRDKRGRFLSRITDAWSWLRK